MTSESLFLVTTGGVLAAAVACGVIWGRLSARLPIPELLRMLTTPLWTGALGLVAGFPLALVFYGARIRDSPHEGAMLASAIACFGFGVLLGLPAILGWAFGYRKPSSDERGTTFRT